MSRAQTTGASNHAGAGGSRPASASAIHCHAASSNPSTGGSGTPMTEPFMSPGPDRPALRRAQALAAGSEAGLAIMREILRHKLAGEAAVARLLGGEDTAALIDGLSGGVVQAETGIHALASEAAAASAYWALWAGVRVQFARRDRVPDHWSVFGSRRPSRAAPESRSGMSGSNRPRNAASAPAALLNYLFGLAASQMTIALAAVGLDPGIGVFHADKEGRASLAYDAIEAVRPYIEAWLLCVIAECRFAKRDFWEEGDGAIRITRPLTSWLALSTPLWRSAAEVVARWLADAFERSARLPGGAGIEDDVIGAAEKVGETLPVPAAAKAVERRIAPRIPRGPFRRCCPRCRPPGAATSRRSRTRSSRGLATSAGERLCRRRANRTLLRGGSFVPHHAPRSTAPRCGGWRRSKGGAQR